MVQKKKKLYKFQKELKRNQASVDATERMQRINSDLFGKDDALYMNDPITFTNGYTMSIQCSTGHYCSPRTTMLDPTAYDAYEIAIFYVDKEKELDFNNVFSDISFESGYLAGYVNAVDVQRVYDYVEKLRTPESRKATITDILPEL